MKGVLVRVGIDQSSKGGVWNGPVCSRSGEFVYVPIPDSEGKVYHPGLEHTYNEVLPSLDDFAAAHKVGNLGFPAALLSRSMHLDPDFQHLTYGDNGLKQGRAVADLREGDFIVFFSSLKAIETNKLVYALIGFYEVSENIRPSDVKSDRYHQNAHTRWRPARDTDIIIRAVPTKSGRLRRCVPIGEYRDGAYRVTDKLLKAWGGLNVRDGFLQRRVTPSFSDPHKFRSWFEAQGAALIHANNESMKESVVK